MKNESLSFYSAKAQELCFESMEKIFNFVRNPLHKVSWTGEVIATDKLFSGPEIQN